MMIVFETQSYVARLTLNLLGSQDHLELLTLLSLSPWCWDLFLIAENHSCFNVGTFKEYACMCCYGTEQNCKVLSL